MLRSLLSYDITLESHELNNTYFSSYVDAKLLCNGDKDKTERRTTLESDVQCYLLLIKHRLTLFSCTNSFQVHV